MMVMTMQCINTFICCYCEDKAARIRDKKLFVATQEGPLDQRATEIQRGASLETTNNHSAPSCHDIKLTSYKLYYILYTGSLKIMVGQKLHLRAIKRHQIKF